MFIHINEFGAIGDGITENTAVIQKAIDSCSEAGGGTVCISGGVYMSYTLFMKSGVELRIEAGATLLGGPDPLKYPEVEDNPYWIPKRCSRLNRRCLIYALHCDSIAITGRGTIDGHAQNFTHCTDEELLLHVVWKRKSNVDIPGRTLLIVDCTNVLLKDFLILDSAGWSMWILKCFRVQMERLRIDCDMRLPNVDGIHISASSDVTVSGCIIRSSDDSIVLRAHQEQLYEPKPCERVAISNCTLESGSSAIRIGWSNDYLIRDCTFSNLVVKKSFAGIAIFIPAIGEENIDPPRGKAAPVPPETIQPFGAENLHFDNIVLETEASPFLIRLAQEAEVSLIRNIRLTNISAKSCGYPFIIAKPEQNVSDIFFSGNRFEIIQGGRENLADYPSFSAFSCFQAVKNLHFDQSSFNTVSS